MRIREHIHAFVCEIWQWYARNKRALPWRDLVMEDESERAYHILVSEVMLQQTQVERVKIVFKEFLDRYPFMRDLAAASNREVLIAWRGMGYNSRALRLRDAALEIVDRFLGSSVARSRMSGSQTSYQATELTCPSCSGNFPRCMPCLLSIKGIGPYTAAAIRNFAFGVPTPCIDTNIRRVLHRTFVGAENLDGTWKASDKELLKLAEEVLEVALKFSSSERSESRSLSTRTSCFDSAQHDMLGARSGKTADWHHALMDFGSLVQTKTNPKWDLCPLTKKGLCKAAYSLRHAEPVEARRKVAPKKEPGRLVGTVFIPNRIFRGKIVEELRDAKRGLPLSELGKRICLDWKRSEHEKWLKGILAKLERDALIKQRKGKYILKP